MAFSINEKTLVATLDGVDYPSKVLNGTRLSLTEEECIAIKNAKIASDETLFERTLENLRRTRNELLAETDWMANSDVTISDAMRTYRQELRDITNGLTTVEDVNAVTFPTKPE